VLRPVPHRQYVFTVPKLIRPFFAYRRSLRGELCRIVARSLTQAYRAAHPRARPGFIVFVQTFGDLVNFNPHVHALVADGVFEASGRFIPLPPIPEALLAGPLRREVIRRLVRREVIVPPLAAQMLAWRHSGFTVHNQVRVAANDAEGRKALAGYMLRAPFSLEKTTYDAHHRLPDAHVGARPAGVAGAPAPARCVARRRGRGRTRRGVLPHRDHGMNYKKRCRDLDNALGARGSRVRFALSAEKDRYVKRHRTFGGTAYVWLNSPEDAPEVRERIPQLEGIEAVRTREEAARDFDLMPDRIGEPVVTGDRDTVFGELQTDQENLEASYRSHGSLHEPDVPLVIYNCKEELPAPAAFTRNADLIHFMLR
jgi:hypothetical protein